jgi:toxin YhaV
VPATINGWLVLVRPAFTRRYQALREEARQFQQRLPPDEYVRHPLVKLAAAVQRLVTEIVPSDPKAPEFRLRGELGRFRRAKGRGLPPRYRLFWIFSQQARVIIFLYLNDEETLRKEGAQSDPYEVFKRLLASGEIGADFEANLAAWHREHADASAPRSPPSTARRVPGRSRRRPPRR